MLEKCDTRMKHIPAKRELQATVNSKLPWPTTITVSKYHLSVNAVEYCEERFYIINLPCL